MSSISCLALAIGLAGCDGGDDPVDAASLQPEVFAGSMANDFELGIDLEPALAEQAAQADEWLASIDQDALACNPYNNISPTESLMIGWVRWALGQPMPDGPIADQTGEKCGLNQSGHVFYLAGTFGGPVTRECDVPAGKQLFFPLLNNWGVFPPEFYADEAAMDAVMPWYVNFFAASRAATCSLTLRVDGQDLRPDLASLDADTYVEVLERFEINLDDDHWAPGNFAGGEMPAVGNGHYVLLPPLSAGDHVIEFGGERCNYRPFATSATYLLHVGP